MRLALALTALMLAWTQQLCAQALDITALLKDADRSIGQIVDPPMRRELLEVVAGAAVLERSEDAAYWIGAARHAAGGCPPKLVAALVASNARELELCRDSAPARLARIMNGEELAVFAEYAGIADREARAEFLADIASTLVALDRRQALAAIASLPLDVVTKDDFHRAVAWSAAGLGKFEMARAAIDKIDTKREQMAALLDLAAHYLDSGRRDDSHAVLRQVAARFDAADKSAAFRGASRKSRQLKTRLDIGAVRSIPLLDLFLAPAALGPFTELFLAQTAAGDRLGQKMVLAMVDEILVRGDFAGEDYAWNDTIIVAMLANLLAGGADGLDALMGQLQRWLDANTADAYYDQRRHLTDWMTAWAIAKREQAAASSVASINADIAAADGIARALIMAWLIDQRGSGAVRELLAIDHGRYARISVNDALWIAVFANPAIAGLAQGHVLSAPAVDREDGRRLEDMVLLLLARGEPGQARRALAALQAADRPFRPKLVQALIELGDQDAARATALRCAAEPKPGRDCADGLEFLKAALRAGRIDLALAEVDAVREPAVRARALAAVLDWHSSRR